MSNLAPTKREVPVNSLASRTGLAAWFRPYVTSTVGSKMLVAVTGLMLTGFVLAHMIGNLKIFAGRTALNDYAAFLKSLGPLLWVARIGLLVVFALHIYLALKLKKRSLEARPINYAYQNTMIASVSSRTMLWTGLAILAFTIFHLAHFTFGWVGPVEANGKMVGNHEPNDAEMPTRHDVYGMVIHGFRQPVVSILYIVAQMLLLMHLGHGIPSTFQSLGLNTPRTQRMIRAVGWLLALVIVAGNIGIVVGVWFDFVKP
ncbi:MAG: succinate dehydrogenase cytochrome b subunit [Gemmataceae bacterium]|nr:succinate dehydrogenase cytochrome b subunit [Gemmataceae bacterium]